VTKKKASRTGPVKSPSVLDKEILIAPKEMKRAVGLDLGTRCGFAMIEYDPEGIPPLPMPMVGQLDLSVHGWESNPIRLLRLRQFLNVLLPDAIFLEDVKFDPPMREFKLKPAAVLARVSTAAELLGAFKCQVAVWAEDNGVPMHGFAIGEIKRHATGKGNANKVAMIEACNDKFGTGYNVDTYDAEGSDNEADAAFVLDLGMNAYLEGLPK